MDKRSNQKSQFNNKFNEHKSFKIIVDPVDMSLFKVSNTNARTMCDLYKVNDKDTDFDQIHTSWESWIHVSRGSPYLL